MTNIITTAVCINLERQHSIIGSYYGTSGETSIANTESYLLLERSSLTEQINSMGRFKMKLQKEFGQESPL